jgi:hypothetical protein
MQSLLAKVVRYVLIQWVFSPKQEINQRGKQQQTSEGWRVCCAVQSGFQSSVLQYQVTTGGVAAV